LADTIPEDAARAADEATTALSMARAAASKSGAEEARRAEPYLQYSEGTLAAVRKQIPQAREDFEQVFAPESRHLTSASWYNSMTLALEQARASHQRARAAIRSQDQNALLPRAGSGAVGQTSVDPKQLLEETIGWYDQSLESGREALLRSDGDARSRKQYEAALLGRADAQKLLDELNRQEPPPDEQKQPPPQDQPQNQDQQQQQQQNQQDSQQQQQQEQPSNQQQQQQPEQTPPPDGQRPEMNQDVKPPEQGENQGQPQPTPTPDPNKPQEQQAQPTPSPEQDGGEEQTDPPTASPEEAQDAQRGIAEQTPEPSKLDRQGTPTPTPSVEGQRQLTPEEIAAGQAMATDELGMTPDDARAILGTMVDEKAEAQNRRRFLRFFRKESSKEQLKPW